MRSHYFCLTPAAFMPHWFCFTLLFCLSFSISAKTTDAQQDTYLEAQQALKRGEITEFKRLRAQLNDYPLNIYLDYAFLSPRISQLSAQQALDFLASAQGSPLANRFKAQYIRTHGKQRHWQQLLTVQPSVPNGQELQCYFYRAKLGTDQTKQAWQGTQQLWLTGKSLPKACDPLLNAWQKAGKRTDELIWQRMLLSFRASQSSLMTYLNRQFQDPLWQARGDALLKLYRDPARLRLRIANPFSPDMNRDVVYESLYRLTRTKPALAAQLYQSYQPQQQWSEQQQAKLVDRIAMYLMFEEQEQQFVWLDQQLQQQGSDNRIEQRIRYVMRQQNWQQAQQMIRWLSEQRQNEPNWRYWQARLPELLGGKPDTAVYQQLAKERSFHGYLSSIRLGKHRVALKEKEPTDAGLSLADHPGFLRLNELMAIDEYRNARSEWVYLLRAGEPAQLEELAGYAAEQAWWDFAIMAAIEAGAWDVLSYRFPAPYRATFQQFARKHGVDEALLLAIARRESSFYPYARSAANAHGLMQLLPSTAKATARKIGHRYTGTSSLYQVETNVRLGSAYIRELLVKYNGNRILAAAAYNAGPHRVKRWLEDDTPQAFDVWIETIPFRETRNYVQAILTYRALYAQRTLGRRAVEVVSEKEMRATY